MSISMLFTHSVVSDSLRPHGLQHTRLPCPSLSFWVCSNSCPLSWWYHPTILSSVIPFSSCLQSFPVSGSSLMSQLFQSGFQSIGASALASVLPVKIQGWFPLGWTGLISISIYLPSYLSIFPYVTWKSISIYYLVLYQKMFANPDLGFLSALSTWPTHLPGGSDIPLPRYC